MLSAAGKTPSKQNVSLLREAVAQRIYTEVVSDGCLGSFRVKDVVTSTHMTLAAYISATKHEAWASQIELAVCADHLGIRVALDIHAKCVHHVIRLVKNHFKYIREWSLRATQYRRRR